MTAVKEWRHVETRVVSGSWLEEEALVSVVTVTSLHQSLLLHPTCKISPVLARISHTRISRLLVNCLSVFWKIRIYTIPLFLFNNLKLKVTAL